MRGLIAFALAATLVVAAAPPASADGAMIEGFTMQPEAGWRFFTDGVMGGVSSGGLVFAQEDGQPHARMTGRVSTANRGGFIQMRLDLASPPPKVRERPDDTQCTGCRHRVTVRPCRDDHPL